MLLLKLTVALVYQSQGQLPRNDAIRSQEKSMTIADGASSEAAGYQTNYEEHSAWCRGISLVPIGFE